MERRLGDAFSFIPRIHYIFFTGQISWWPYSHHLAEKAVGHKYTWVSLFQANKKTLNALWSWVYQVEIARALVQNFGNNWIVPYIMDGLCNLNVERDAAITRIELVAEDFFNASLCKQT